MTAAITLAMTLAMTPAMTPERYYQVNQLFHEALELAGEDRADFLTKACGGDESLRLAVERMLVAREKAGSFLNEPAFYSGSNPLIEKHSDSLIGSVIGHYEILSKLGEGGMGEVFLAQDDRLGRLIALKLLPAEFTSNRDRLRRFEQEARAASALNHPNIITIHEIGRTKIESCDLHYIAQEFIEGQTLRRRIEHGSLSTLDALDISIQAANALQVAHAANIVHRDIKPENIMLRPDGFIKILDFGLAKLIDRLPARSSFIVDKSTLAMSGTAPGMILGTAAYMSPEQARGLEIDARSDIWSMGVVLYQSLTGEEPFKGETFTDVIVSIIEREPAPLSRSLSKVPPELERIVMKTLAKNRDERYQTAKDLAIDLKNLKRKLEFDSEIAQKPESESVRHTADGQLRTDQQTALNTDARIRKTMRLQSALASKRWLPVLASLFVIIVIVSSVWYSTRSKPAAPADLSAPERRISYSLTVQRMRDGVPYREPFESIGQEILESGWKIRFRFSSSQPGYLYLLNEGAPSNGAISYNVLFPFPSINNGSAQMSAGQPIQTGWNFLSQRAGTERLLLVWSSKAASELEEVKDVVNPKDKGLISDPAKLSAVRMFLNRHSLSRPEAKPEISVDKDKKQTEVTSRGAVLVHSFELEHR